MCTCCTCMLLVSCFALQLVPCICDTVLTLLVSLLIGNMYYTRTSLTLLLVSFNSSGICMTTGWTSCRRVFLMLPLNSIGCKFVIAECVMGPIALYFVQWTQQLIACVNDTLHDSSHLDCPCECTVHFNPFGTTLAYLGMFFEMRITWTYWFNHPGFLGSKVYTKLDPVIRPSTFNHAHLLRNICAGSANPQLYPISSTPFGLLLVLYHLVYSLFVYYT